jgi:hypothetical protein
MYSKILEGFLEKNQATKKNNTLKMSRYNVIDDLEINGVKAISNEVVANLGNA